MRTFPRLNPKPRPSGFYEIVWSEPGPNNRPRSMRRSTGCKDREGAEKALAQFLSVRDVAKDEGWNFDDVADRYIIRHSTPLGNQVTDKHCLRAPRECFGAFRADSITNATVQDFIRARQLGRYGRIAVKAATARREVVVLQAALNWAHDSGLIGGGPYRFKKPADGPPRDLWLTEQQQHDLLSQLPSEPVDVRLFTRMGLTYGVRKSAMTDLCFGPQVSFITETIDFNPPGRRETRKRRPMSAMTPTIRADLASAFVGKRAGDQVLRAATPDRFKDFVKRAGYEWVTPHVMKHTAITLMLRSGIPLDTVSKVTETDIRTLLKNYRHHCMSEMKTLMASRNI